MGVSGGRLDGHDYFFISNGTGSAEQAAARAYEQIQSVVTSPAQRQRFAVYYLGDDGQVYRYLGQNNSVRIGPQLPN